jgi:taurine dioxygenase
MASLSREKPMGAELDWKLLAIGFGAEIDYDLKIPMTPAQQEAFRGLYAEHNLLVFHEQTITKEEQTSVMAHLGPTLDDVRDFGLVSNVRREGVFGVTALEFHSDNIFMAEPIHGVSLFGLEVVDGASTTNFANTVRAYQTMPESLRQRLRNLKSIQIHPYYLTRRNTADVVPKDDRRPSYTRPIVIKHRTTDAPMICMTAMNTDRVVGLPHQEGEDVIREVFSYLYASENIYSHPWRNGDLVIWDNLAMQHGRGPLTEVGERTLRRVAIGTQGFNEQPYADLVREEEIYIQS